MSQLGDSRRWELNPGYVYFIRCGDIVKIGYAKDPLKRMSDLQSANPTELLLEGAIEGTFATETTTHYHFSPIRVRGEWFRLSNLELAKYFEHLKTQGIEVFDAFLLQNREPGQQNVSHATVATTVSKKNGGSDGPKDGWLHIRTDTTLDDKLDSAVKKLKAQGISTSRSGLARTLVLKGLGGNSVDESARQIQRVTESVLKRAIKDALGRVPTLVEQELSG